MRQCVASANAVAKSAAPQDAIHLGQAGRGRCVSRYDCVHALAVTSRIVYIITSIAGGGRVSGRKMENQFDCQCSKAILGLKSEGATRPNPSLTESYRPKQKH
jgi:hypothetical protein